jgi:putative cell wall-binding protein
VLAGVLISALLADVAPARAADEETDTEEADETITTTVDAGDTARTDSSSTAPSATNPIIASVLSAVDGDISLTKLSEVPVVTGYRTFGAVTIEAPAATATNPHRFSISFDLGDVPTGEAIESIVLLRDGAPVPTCEGTATATPDPCFVSRTTSGNAMTIVALTSEASTWTAAWRELERVAPATATTSTAGSIAVAASRRLFPPQSANAVVLARVDDFADALAGAALAASRNAPLLLTSSDSLDDETLDEITRVLAPGELVYVLGGSAAVSTAVVQRLTSWGFLVQRYAGADRYATAAAIAERGLGAPTNIVETTGANFADALAAGSVAARIGGAVLLTNGSTQSTATAAYLRTHRPTRYAIGGPSALADPGATAIAGQDRTETSVLAARRFFSAPPHLTVASGFSYPEAVTAAATAANDGSPLLLVPASGALPVSVQIYLRELATTEPTGVLVGSTSTLGADVETAVRAALAGA